MFWDVDWEHLRACNGKLHLSARGPSRIHHFMWPSSWCLPAHELSACSQRLAPPRRNGEPDAGPSTCRCPPFLVPLGQLESTDLRTRAAGSCSPILPTVAASSCLVDLGRNASRRREARHRLEPTEAPVHRSCRKLFYMYIIMYYNISNYVDYITEQ